jgi:hypothetical protein
MQTFKLRGGMAFLGATRIFGLYRFANIDGARRRQDPRRRSPEKAIGARGLGQLLVAHRPAARGTRW